MYRATSETCENSLSNVGQFGDVDCVVHWVTRQHAEFTLTFLSWPQLPHENNLFFHDGNPHLRDFYCDVSGIVGELIDTRHHSIAITRSCEFVDVVNTNVRGEEESSTPLLQCSAVVSTHPAFVPYLSRCRVCVLFKQRHL